jgi:prevent-host-death family protein
MVKTVGAYDAMTHLAQLLDEVAAGETIVITKHGVPVAQLGPPEGTERPDVGATINAIKELRREVKPLGGLSIRAMIEEGRVTAQPAGTTSG